LPWKAANTASGRIRFRWAWSKPTRRATAGNDGDGRIWDGGKTPGGRFCSVFDFADDGLISRMFIYLDPDYTSLDRDRFHWKRTAARW
jgi:hypothetical protein